MCSSQPASRPASRHVLACPPPRPKWCFHCQMPTSALSPPHCCTAGAVDLTLDLSDWHVIDTLHTAGVRLAGLLLAVQPRWLPLPAELAALTQLTRLSLAGNSFESGWERLPRQLAQLDLSRCNLGELPAELAALTQLSELSLAGNELWPLDTFQLLPAQMRRLDLSNCSLVSVADKLTRLTQLSALCLSCNKHLSGHSLDSLPRQLQQLELSSCRLRDVPTELPRLMRLAELSLDDNPIQNWWPLLWMEGLRQLHLQRCRLQKVPTEVAGLTQLTSLSLAGNPLQGGWQHLPTQLRQLDLQWCGLRRMPVELAALTQLTKLSLGRNHIAGGWQHLPVQLQQLAPHGRGPQLPAVLSGVLGPLLSPKIWAPVASSLRYAPVNPATMALTALAGFGIGISVILLITCVLEWALR